MNAETSEVSVSPKMCVDCRARATKTDRSKRCEVCAETRRKWQLQYHNITWRQRSKVGEAKHRPTYAGQPTRWAIAREVQRVTSSSNENDEQRIEAIVRRVLKTILS